MVARLDNQTNGALNKAALAQVDVNTGAVTFDSLVEFPSSASKFAVRKDPKTGVYYRYNGVKP